MQYVFRDQGDEELIALSELPLEDGIAVAVRTTGYDMESDEIVEIAVADLDGEILFSSKVKPQNVESWEPSEASGGLGPADVADCPELYECEEEISELFEEAEVVVAAHMQFAQAMIEGSWVTLPEFDDFDLTRRFCEAHSASDYPGAPAAAASLADIVAYYGPDNLAESDMADLSDVGVEDEARLVAACYRAFVREHEQARAAKGEDYWRRRDERLAQERAGADREQAVARAREKNLNRMNGLLWIAGALIFASLAIQLSQRGFDMGFIVVCGAAAAFSAARGIANFLK